MPMTPSRRYRVLPWLIAAGLLLLPVRAIPMLAQDALPGLAPGGSATIVTDPGADALVRATPGYEAAVVAPYATGTPVEIIEGPVTAADGSVWYGVSVGGVTGYLAAPSLLPGSGAVAEAPAVDPSLLAEPPAAAAPVADTPVDPAPVPVDTATDPSRGAPYALGDVNLRAEPSPDAVILTVIPDGGFVGLTGGAQNGFLGVTYGDVTGWADAAFIAPAPTNDTPPSPDVDPNTPDLAPAPTAIATDPASPAPATSDTPTDSQQIIADVTSPGTGPLTGATEAPGGTAATVVGLTNLVAGPGGAEATLRVLPADSAIIVTGAEVDGYLPVWYNGTTGWIATTMVANGAALTGTSPAPAPAAADPAASAPAATDASGAAPVSAYNTVDAANLRATPDAASAIIGVVPAGVALTPTAGPENDYYQVSYNGVTGWVSAGLIAASDGTAPASAYNGGPGLDTTRGGTGLIWPVTSGTWQIMQGYNGSSHQNQDSSWQYYYSLDLVRADGNTAGQVVMAPTAGTVRWLDPSTGGISIDIGNGHAVAFFHVTVDGAYTAGTPVQAGQVIGTISGPGGPGFAGTAHLHFALWATTDGGNWSRSAEPFTGAYSIGGMSFPDTGGRNQYRGTVINV